MDERTLAELLDGVAAGQTSVNEAIQRLRDLPYEGVAGLNVDHHRELRTGQAEAVFGPGKTPEQVADAFRALAARASGPVFVTRTTPAQARAACEAVPRARFHERARLVVAPRASPNVSSPGSVAVVSAGASDQPAAEECALTAEALGMKVERVSDVGVAGVHRVLDRRGEIEAADVVVVVAGMEGALPSVVAGLTSRPVIAVPTSVGYGAAFEGIAALLGMLTSCAAGVCVVNIDNGFGAAQVAHRITRSGVRAGG